MAFDEQSGVVVAVVDDETWTLDVASLTWNQGSAAGHDDGRWYWTRLVYDPAADRTVAITEKGSTFLYDADSDTWTEGPSVAAGFNLAVLDGRANRIVSFVADEDDSPRAAWSYSMATATETKLAQDGRRPQGWSPGLVAHVASIDAIVTYTGHEEAGSTHVFDPEAGVWTQISTGTPSLDFKTWPGYAALSYGTEVVYVPDTDRVIVFTGGVTAEYDPFERTWATYPAPDIQLDEAGGGPYGPLVRFRASLVYDSTNKRLLMYGGVVLMPDHWTTFNDLWAYDPTTHEWSQIVDPE